MYFRHNVNERDKKFQFTPAHNIFASLKDSAIQSPGSKPAAASAEDSKSSDAAQSALKELESQLDASHAENRNARSVSIKFDLIKIARTPTSINCVCFQNLL